MATTSPTADPRPGSNPSDTVQRLMQRHGDMFFGLDRRFCCNEDAGLVQKTMLNPFKDRSSFRSVARAIKKSPPGDMPDRIIQTIEQSC
ncbi:MAG: hypothetical protein QGI75_05060 [Phycisphaerales bacterium]|nr:hypothetical protein [Phycisphaerales bacterium]MDP6889695.1 hypothetical protein [Phycisphaerales bacterium]